MKTKPRLDYLFEADFADGTTYFQGLEDESLTYPPDSNGDGKSAYSDVLERLDNVLRFHLVGEDGRYTVDLTDGHFEVNGLPFAIEGKDLPLTNLELIYLRYTNVESTVSASVQEGKWNWLGSKEMNRAHYVDRYVIGYKAMQAGKQIERCISIAGGK